mgnify:CR=1 FL=1
MIKKSLSTLALNLLFHAYSPAYRIKDIKLSENFKIDRFSENIEIYYNVSLLISNDKANAIYNFMQRII